MTKKPSTQPDKQLRIDQNSREARLAEALRTNLRKRKAAAKAKKPT